MGNRGMDWRHCQDWDLHLQDRSKDARAGSRQEDDTLGAKTMKNFLHRLGTPDPPVNRFEARLVKALKSVHDIAKLTSLKLALVDIVVDWHCYESLALAMENWNPTTWICNAFQIIVKTAVKSNIVAVVIDTFAIKTPLAPGRALDSSSTRADPSISCFSMVATTGTSFKLLLRHSWILVPPVEPVWCRFFLPPTMPARRLPSPGMQMTVSICGRVKTSTAVANSLGPAHRLEF